MIHGGNTPTPPTPVQADVDEGLVRSSQAPNNNDDDLEDLLNWMRDKEDSEIAEEEGQDIM